MHTQHFLIAEQERSIYDSCRFGIGRFRAEPTNYERCLHPSDIFAYRSAHNNLFLTLRVIHKLKKQLCSCSTLFLYISLPLFCTTTTWNFQKLLSYTFNSLPPIFTFAFDWWPLAFLILSPPLQNFNVALPTKKVSPFLSLVPDLSRPFPRWASLAYRLLSVFLTLSPAVYSKFVDMTINLRLIL